MKNDFIVVFSLGIELMLLEKEMLEEKFGNIEVEEKSKHEIRDSSTGFRF